MIDNNKMIDFVRFYFDYPISKTVINNMQVVFVQFISFF